MRLPDPSELREASEHFLLEHDRAELHNVDRRAFSHRMYMARFRRVIHVVERLTALFAKPREDLRILDVGCAQGNFSLILAEQGYRVFAVDLQLPFLRYVRLKHEHGPLWCVNASVEALPFRRGFDVILLGEVLEHVAEPTIVLQHVRALLSETGYLVVTTPNGDRLHTGMPTFSEIGDRRQLLNRQFRPDADGHLYLMTRQELTREVRHAGLRVVQHEYMASPLVTGRLRFRTFVQFMPVWIADMLDQWLVARGAIGRFLAEGQLIVARR